MGKLLKEFKDFAIKGNVMDMAIGVVIGAAFGAITTALVGSVITPLLAWIFGAPNTDALNITLRAADEAAGTEALVLGLGTFVGAIVNFILIALVLFLVVKGINKMKRPPEPAPEPAPAGPTTEELLGEIRDLLKEGK